MKKLIENIKFIIRNNLILKMILRKPVRFIRKIRKLSLSRKEYKKVSDKIYSSEELHNRVFFFCAAIHPNLGDLAQRFCIENWITENFPNSDIIVVPSICFTWFKKQTLITIKSIVKETDVLVFQSGYTMSDFHPDDNVRKYILKQYNRNSCIIFPQTILYKDLKKEDTIKIVLNQHKRLLLLARDQISYKYASNSFFNVKCRLYPDIVTSLIGKYDFSQNCRLGIGMCLRNDGEKFYSYKQIDDLVNELKKYEEVEITDTDCGKIKDFENDTIKKEIFNKIKKFSKYKVIITDRYHGTIFSLIAGTPVIVIKTNDHKVSSGVNWFNDVYHDYVYYAESLEEVPALVTKIINMQFSYQLHSYFKEKYYDNLKKEIY